MNIEIVIIWYNGKPAGLWYHDKLLWETEEVIIETELLKTVVVLPLLEAIRYTAILINGMTIDRLSELLDTIKVKILELNKLKAENQKEEIEHDIDW